MPSPLISNLLGAIAIYFNQCHIRTVVMDYEGNLYKVDLTDLTIKNPNIALFKDL